MRLPRLLHTCAREDGVALVMALGFLLLLTMGFAASIALTASGARNSFRSGADQKAYALAEAGVNDAVSVIFADPNVDAAAAVDCGVPESYATYAALLPPPPPSVAAATTERDEGTVRWGGTFECDGDAPYWRVRADATVRNPTGPGAGAVTRSVSAKVPLGAQEVSGEGDVTTETVYETVVDTQTTTVPGDTLQYGGAYFYAKDGDVSSPGGNLSVEVPIFATGNFDWTQSTASSWVWAVARLINVGGSIRTNGIGLIGDRASTLATAVTASSTSINANGSDESLFNSQSVLKLVDPADPTRIEFFKYTSRSSGGFAGSGFLRGYGGKGAPTAKAWPVGTIITGALELREGAGCAPLACTSANKVYASNTPQPDSNLLPFPSLMAPDMTTLYAEAAPGPTTTPSRPRTCTGTPPVFDNNSALDRSAATPALPIDLAPSGVPYDCTQLAPDGSTGRLKWDGTTLTVRGTVFVDGDIKFGKVVLYNTGSAGATIYTSGSIDLKAAHFCAAKTTPSASDCNMLGYDPSTNPTGWDSDANRLGLVAATFPGDPGYSHNVDSTKHVQALVYCDGQYSQGTGAKFQGLVQCDSVYLREGGSAPSPSVSEIPGGFPRPPQVVTVTSTTTNPIATVTSGTETTTTTVRAPTTPSEFGG